jgi:hypothetical protein
MSLMAVMISSRFMFSLVSGRPLDEVRVRRSGGRR